MDRCILLIFPFKLSIFFIELSIVFLIIASIFFIFLDELIMGCSQRRIGPLNLGWYGILTSLINGCNLFISQFIVPKFNVNSGFQLFTILFFIFSFFNLVMHYPFFLIDIYNSIILTLLLTDISLFLPLIYCIFFIKVLAALC